MKDKELKLEETETSHTLVEISNTVLIFIYLLWINKVKDKDKIYMWVSVLWKTTNWN